MSLILEALRKSEAERRLGSAPDVLRAMPVMRVSAPRSRWPLAAALGAGVLILAAALFWWSQRTATQAATAVATSAPSRTMPTTFRQAAPTVSAIPVAAAPARAVPHEAPRPAASSTPPAAPTLSANPFPQPLSTPAPLAATAAPVATPTPASAANAEPALLTLGDLSADERAGLPALKVTMHVFADDPAKRFMIVDGQRVGEGARLAEGVLLLHIRRDGAELDLRGRRVLLPKP